MDANKEKIRNFAIIAHIDHGKSTLADRLIEETGVMEKREIKDQVLDTMDIERERGITIKLQAIQLKYKADDGEIYTLNLIDTPGHVDFNYEVSRSLAACDGALLVVDASQGIQAQTIANTYLALENDLEILPVINKIDLKSARAKEVKEEIEDTIGIEAQNAPEISAKNNINIHDVLETIVKNIPAPEGDLKNPTQALIFDAFYDPYRGVIISVRIKEGQLKVGDEILMMKKGGSFEIEELGIFTGKLEPTENLKAGDVGYIICGIKDLSQTRIGDTITLKANPATTALPGYKEVTPMVYAGFYPSDGAKYEDLKQALLKLQLNDAALVFEPETSVALGFGFRCGFLGLLHLEVILERLEREFDLDLITTAPSVIYEITKTDGTELKIDNPSNYPDPSEIKEVREPIVSAEILSPSEYIGTIMQLCQEKRGVYYTMDYVGEDRVILKYDLPLNEIIYDFFDQLKSRTRGYASLDYELKSYEPSKLVKLDIRLNQETVDALSFILHEDRAIQKGRVICKKLKENIPRQLFEIPIQAAIGSKIVARETQSALRKDVLSKCYGGDITRKRKLLEKQKKGKKRLKKLGNVEIPQSAFMAVLKMDE